MTRTFICPDCGWYHEETNLKLPAVKCIHCGTLMESIDLPEDNFENTEQIDEPLVDSIDDEQLDDEDGH